MKINFHEKRFLNIIILSLLIFAMTSNFCNAQEWSRFDKSQIYGIFQTMAGDKSKVRDESLKVKVDIKDTYVYGIGLAYDFTEKWNLNTDFLFGTVDTEGAPEGVEKQKYSPNIYLWDVNVDYCIWKRRFSPLATGGLGVIYFIGDGFDQFDFSYNLGAGLRWDAMDYLFVKAIYRLTWTKMENHDDRILLDGVSLGIGYMY